MTIILILIASITLFIIFISNKNKEANIKQSNSSGSFLPIDIKTNKLDYTCHDPSKYKMPRVIYHHISQDQVKQISLQQIANNFKCTPSDVKDFYFNILRTFKLEFVLNKIDEKVYQIPKHIQSQKLYIKPEDTPAAFMEKWIIEYIENKEYSYRKRTKFEVMEDIMALYPEYGEVIKSGNKEREKKFIDNNPYIVEVIMEELADADNPAEKYRLRAFDTMSIDKNYSEAINLLNKGLEFDEPQTEPFIFELRAQCEEKLLNYNKALQDMTKAIELILKNLPDQYYEKSIFMKKRSEIKGKLGDIIGADRDRKLAEIFYAKYEATENHNDDLPF